MTSGGPVAAFFAPMKPVDAARPSGDRRIARLTVAALEGAGFRVEVASRLRTLEMAGDAGAQARLRAAAAAEVARLVEGWRAAPPAVWVTYHCYWKAPDLVGPGVCGALGLPYVITEPSLSVRRREGPWAGFAAAAEDAMAAADLLLWSTGRDRPALAARFPADRLAELPPFVEVGQAPGPRAAGGPLRLIAVGMMRPGDKLASYRALAAGLAEARCDWRLEVVGDGAAREAVRAAFAGFGDRVRWAGVREGPALRAALERAELLVWPGVGEGIGMVYLEAQAAGAACLAEDRPGPRDVLAPGAFVVPAGDAAALGAAVDAAAADRAGLAARGASARGHAMARHSLGAASAALGGYLRRLIGGGA